MGKRIFDISVIIIFLGFAYVQLNDSDPTKWVIMYSMIVMLGLLSLANKLKTMYALFIVAFFIGYLISNFDLFTSWISAGRPAFIDYEPTNIQEVENIREFLGLIICLLASLAYLFLSLRKKKKDNPHT